MNDQFSPTERRENGSEAELEKFIYHISHDLKASMRALTLVPVWIVEDLEAELGSVPASVQQHVDLLATQAKRLDAMMADLLAYSRVGSMQATGPVLLSGALADILNQHELPEGFDLRQNFLVPVLTGGTRDIPDLLGVFLSNAIKHGATSLAFETDRHDGHTILSATDNGPGIDPKHHRRIFDLMTTLKPRDEVEGSGIGLAMAHKIVVDHGGTLTVESDGEAGARFVAAFPDGTES